MDFNSVSDRELRDVIRKVLDSEELTSDDGIRLMLSNNLLLIGALANYLRKKTVGDDVMFVVNRHINYTNICKSKCRICAYYKEEGQAGAYVMSIPDILEKVKEASSIGVTELHIVGSLNPSLPVEFYEDMLTEIHDRYPDMSLKALTAVEIHYLAESSGMSVKDILLRLKKAGLTSLPGGGGEIFNKRVREFICPGKITGEQWLDVMETAHRLGIKSNATMLYGHIEQPEDIVDHILRIRELQKKTHGFQAFIPLSFHPQNTDLQKCGAVKYGPTGFDDLKVIAVARLLLNGYVNYIKAYWVMLGEKLAQVSLNFGANDLDGTVIEEKITHAAGAQTEQHMPKERLIRLIRSAGRIPVERTADYGVVRRYGQAR